jgi:competence protein ComEC
MKRSPIAKIFFALVLISLSASFTERRTGRLSAKPLAPASLQVYVLDVGQGDSLLIISPTGQAGLIDAGSASAGERVVAALRRHGVKLLDLAIATQPDDEHVGGMKRVLGSSDIQVKSFLDSGQPSTLKGYQQTMATVSLLRIPVVKAKRGMTFDLGGGARLDVINPAGDGTWIENTGAGGNREKANSIVLRLSYRDFTMLFAGDASTATEEAMLAAGQNVWAPVLKVGDHGSGQATGEKFLSFVKPKVAIISAGAGSASYPSPETLERLRRSKAEIYRTDLNGEIAITSDGKNQQVTAERKKQ